MQRLRGELQTQPRVVEMNRQPWVFSADDSRFLLSVDDYDEARHSDLWNLIKNRLAAEFIYESVYGGENYRLRYRLETVADASS